MPIIVDTFLWMLMESMLMCLYFHKRAIREDGVEAKCKVYIIQGALPQAEGVIALCLDFKLGSEVMNQAIFSPNSIFRRLCHMSIVYKYVNCHTIRFQDWLQSGIIISQKASQPPSQPAFRLS
jgi:hypothetical protein